jgi:hypothetical protein
MRDLTIYVPLCVLSLLAHSALPSGATVLRPAPKDAEPRGQYVEARTASVFAGACHYGSEYTTAGREALLAWHFEGGSWHGVDLTGANVALAVAGEENLAEAGGAHHAFVYTDAKCSSERRAAAVDFVMASCRELAGEVRGVKCTELAVAFDGERFSVVAPELFELRGSLLENRECCKMPYDVWYAPFVDVVHPIVGCNAIFSFEDRALGPIWKRSGQNETFVGRFDPSDRHPAAAENSPTCVMTTCCVSSVSGLNSPSRENSRSCEKSKVGQGATTCLPRDPLRSVPALAVAAGDRR